MKFVDQALVTVISGNGGPGCVSFRRERFIPKGGPDGGNGGKGGDVVFAASSQKRTLLQFQYNQHIRAQNGSGGGGGRKSGKNGADKIVQVPPGTLVTDPETGQILFDLDTPQSRFTVAKGGRGGRGNAFFKSATHRTPRFAQPGEPGETRLFRLELKLLADVGIVGLPNAGKSTLIRALSSARPKVGAYPFTTLIPSLGMVKTGWCEPFVVADIPGLIKGAHEGAGLGHRFLRHVERSRLLLHLVDADAIDPENPLEGLSVVEAELGGHDPRLLKKPKILVLNKLDITGADHKAAAFKQALPNELVLEISAAAQTGIRELIEHLARLLDRDPDAD